MTAIFPQNVKSAPRRSGIVALVSVALYLAVVVLYAIAQINGGLWAATHFWPALIGNSLVPLAIIALSSSVWAITRGRSNRVIGILGCVAVFLPAVVLAVALVVGSQSY